MSSTKNGGLPDGDATGASSAGRGVSTPSDLFAQLWEALADVLGTAATAALLRRAAKRASRRAPELGDLTIGRVELDYKYTAPPAWQEAGGGMQPLHELIRELRPLLVELTGSVVVQRLDRMIDLQPQSVDPPL
jgi:hypothetical protein